MMTHTTPSGKIITIRPVLATDAEMIVRYVNDLSAEDTFTTFGGEIFSLLDEQYYIDSCIASMQRGNMIKLVAICDGEIVATGDVSRDLASRTRSYHVATLGISVSSDLRRQGLGEAMMTHLLSEAKRIIPGLQIVRLDLFSTNIAAFKLYQKLGFVLHGSLPGGILHKGTHVDRLLMYRKI